MTVWWLFPFFILGNPNAEQYNISSIMFLNEPQRCTIFNSFDLYSISHVITTTVRNLLQDK